MVLLGVALAGMFVAAAWRARGPDRAMYAAVFALMLSWAVEAGVDWDWEMPVVTVIVFALGGMVLARAPARAVAEGREVAAGEMATGEGAAGEGREGGPGWVVPASRASEGEGGRRL